MNPSDREPVYLKETDFSSNRTSEMTYRRIYTMLYKCTSGYYRVKGNYDSKSREAQITVDTGVGFENDLYFADNHVMSIAIRHAAIRLTVGIGENVSGTVMMLSAGYYRAEKRLALTRINLRRGTPTASVRVEPLVAN